MFAFLGGRHFVDILLVASIPVVILLVASVIPVASSWRRGTRELGRSERRASIGSSILTEAVPHPVATDCPECQVRVYFGILEFFFFSSCPNFAD